ncbi:MAG TPA: hypothetical protein VM734_22580 [Kofleriaceae bacterium]|nr:hypothetical protein [Kofleriaceae bacterium]
MNRASSYSLALFVLSSVVACGPNVSPGGDDDPKPPVDAADPPPIDAPPEPTSVFPTDPIIDPTAPPNAPDLFDDPGSTVGGPCLLEPEVGALFPHGWLRPRFRLAAPGNHNLFELRLHVNGQANDLVVYTAQPVWILPNTIWQALNQVAVNQPIEVRVRSARYNGTGLDAPPSTGTVGSFTIAPVAAQGSIVYWTTGTGAGALKGFDVGDENVRGVLVPQDAGTVCIGCHTSTPDGQFVAFNGRNAPTDGRPAYADVRSLDGTATRPSFITPDAIALLSRTFQHQPVFSKGHWTPGDRIALSTLGQDDTGGQGSRSRLIWTDLEATSQAEGVGWGTLTRTGDTGYAAAPAFSNDGVAIAYTGAAYISSGMNLDRGGGDIWTIPYNDGLGGTAIKLPGASSAEYSEHYPAFSADDQLIAFTRVPNSSSSYDKAVSEIWVERFRGGQGDTPVRLAANDAPACSGQVSPGLTNSWPKWSPQAEVHGDTTYYWLTFSSRRDPRHIDPLDEEVVNRPRPQLYVTAITVTNGVIKTYPSIYFWNQPETENNHTPAWDNFDIPID